MINNDDRVRYSQQTIDRAMRRARVERSLAFRSALRRAFGR